MHISLLGVETGDETGFLLTIDWWQTPIPESFRRAKEKDAGKLESRIGCGEASNAN